MKRESVILNSFVIERVNQIKLFQVRIPREAKNIIGVEIGMRWLNGVIPLPFSSVGLPTLPIGGMPMMVRRNQLVGELKLQSYEKANIFYTGELGLNQNIDIGDFTDSKFPAKVYSHQTSMNEDPVSVNGNTTLLQGAFRDRFNASGAFQYRVFVYVWVEAKEDQSNL